MPHHINESTNNLKPKLEHTLSESEERINQFATLVELGTILNSSLEPKEVRRKIKSLAKSFLR